MDYPSPYYRGSEQHVIPGGSRASDEIIFCRLYSVNRETRANIYRIKIKK